KVIDDRYIFFKGSKKIITKQITSKPLVKIAPTKVFISTNYNKMDIERVGEALNEFSVVLKKILTDSEFNKNDKVNVTLGQSVKANGSTVSLMYGTMSAYLFKLIGPNEVLYFNQRKIKGHIEDDGNL